MDGGFPCRLGPFTASEQHLREIYAKSGQLESVILSSVIVYAVVDDSLAATSPLGDAVETFIRREDAERFIHEVRGDDPELATYLRIEERRA